MDTVKVDNLRCGHLLSALAGKARTAPDGVATPLTVLTHLQAPPAKATSESAIRKAQQVADGRSGVGTTVFSTLLDYEVEGLSRSVASAAKRLWRTLLSLADEAAALGARSKGNTSPSDMAAAGQIHAHCDALSRQLCELDTLARSNAEAAAQLAQLWDSRPEGVLPSAAALQAAAAGLDTSSQAQYAAAVVERLGLAAALDPILLGLSDVYEALRELDCAGDTTSVAEGPDLSGATAADAAAVAAGTWVPPDVFKRKTTKYWAKPENLTSIMVEIVKHLPLLVFGRDRADRLTSDPRSSRQQAAVRGTPAAPRIASVYYDNANDLSSYGGRLNKEHGASLVRFRWYGQRTADPDQRLWVERKVHQEKWSGEPSYKERAFLDQQHAAEYASGVWPDGLKVDGKRAELLQDIQTWLSSTSQEPVLRTACARAAFQLDANNAVRISIDSDLSFTRETGAPRGPWGWCRDDDAPVGPDERQVFPYAVVEIKLSDTAMPPWLSALLAAGHLLQVPNFSKFLHGAAVLFPRQVVPHGVPYWFLPDEQDGTKVTPATFEEMAESAALEVEDALAEGQVKPGGGVPTGGAAPLQNWLVAAALSAEAESGTSVKRPSSMAGNQLSVAMPWPAISRAGSVAGPRVLGISPRASTVSSTRSGSVRWPAGDSAADDDGSGSSLDGSRPPTPRGTSSASPPAAPKPQGQRPLPYPLPAGAGGRHSSDAPGLLSPSHSGTASSFHTLAPTLPPAPTPVVAPVASAQVNQRQQQQTGGDVETGTAAEPTPALGQRGKGVKRWRLVRPAWCMGKQARRNAATKAALLHGGAPKGRAAALVRTRVEPKTFFANERTFLAWLQIAALIMLMALSLMSGSGGVSGGASAVGGSGTTNTTATAGGNITIQQSASEVTGLVVVPVALAFIFYSLYVYKKRTQAIMSKKNIRYDDQKGPVALVLAMAVVLIIAAVLTGVRVYS